MALLLSYGPLLLLTIMVELIVVAIAAPQKRRKEALATCVALNLVTHPLATLLVWRLGADILSMELSVFLFEWVGYSVVSRLPIAAALRCALLANLLSALVGLVI